MLGHELTHGFDNVGRHFDSNGNVRQWWTNETVTRYTEKTDCFIRHYNTYYEADVSCYVVTLSYFATLRTFRKERERREERGRRKRMWYGARV